MKRVFPPLQVGVAHSGEAASLGVDASEAGPAGPGGLRAFGGSGGAASSTPQAGGMSAAEQKRHADARSELFSQPPPRRDAPAAVSQAAPAAAPSSGGRSKAPPSSSEAPPAAAPPSEGADADYDYEQAFAAMGGVEEDGDAAEVAGAEGMSAPAAGDAGPPEEDLGLM